MLKILYSSLLIQEGININFDKSLYPLDDYYHFTTNNSTIELNINFDNIIKCINEGKVIPQRHNFFKVLKYYYELQSKNKIKEFFTKKYCRSSNQKIIGNNILQIRDIFFNLNNSSIYKNLYYTSYQGGVYLEKFIYGKYHRNKKFEELILSKSSNNPSVICISNNRLNFWKKMLEDKNIIILNSYTNLKKITYRDISKADFVLVTINLLNNINYKNKYSEYKINNEFSEQTFVNIRNDLLENENLQWEYEPLLHIVDWESCIIDFCFEEIKKNMNDLFFKFNTQKKWIIYNEFIKNKDNIETIKNIFNSDISYFDLENFLISGDDFIPEIKGCFEKEIFDPLFLKLMI